MKGFHGGTRAGNRGPNDIIHTPDWLAYRMAQLAKIEPWMAVLDPCAGEHAQPLMDGVSNWICRFGKQHQRLLMGYEIGLGSDVVTRLDGGHVVGADFLDTPKPDTLEAFDRIIMNPPFSNLGAWRFIRHAMDWLKPGGQIFSIVPNYILVQNLERNRWFNSHLTGHWRIPTNTFAPDVKVLHGSVVRVEKASRVDNLGFLFPEEND